MASSSSSISLAHKLPKSSLLQKPGTLVKSNPNSPNTSFPLPCNKPVTTFKISAKAKGGHPNGSVATTVKKPAPAHKVPRKTKAEEDLAAGIKKAKETRKAQWAMALDTLLRQIDSINTKIITHFMDQPDVANPMLTVLADVKELVQIHKGNLDSNDQVPTADAALKVAQHLQVFKESTSENGLIPVNPKPKKTMFSPMIDMFTEVANLLYGQRGAYAYLQDNFAPVRNETPPTEAKVVQGQIPAAIKGTMIRNGPNPQFDPLAMYQWLDGDGMLHALHFKDGKAIYVSRYTQTSRFKQERITGQAEFPKYGDFTGGFGIFMAFTQLLKSIFVLDMSYGFGTANENIVYHNGMLMALEDFDRPYAIKIKEDGDLETLGLYDFNKKLTHNFTPHTKKDHRTGELFTFGSSYTKPYMTYRVISADGTISDPLSIEVSGPTYMHDFCITENYVIIMDLPFEFNPEDMLKHNDWIYNFDATKKSHFGIRLRDPTKESEIKWFEFEEPFFIFHNANAWEEGDNVVLLGCRMGGQQSETDTKPVIKAALLCRAIAGEELKLGLPELYKFTFNMKTGECRQERVSTSKLDYAKINEDHMARKSRYIYASEFNEAGKISSILKFDLDAGRETKVTFGGNTYGSEVVFVPSENATAEDDGYLISYVHDEDENQSYAYVINAHTLEKEAVIELPGRVPYGFHCIFITKEELKKQKSLP